MRGKTKSFFEDTFILLIAAVLIYGIYSFLFSSNEEIKIEEPKIVVENKVETNNYKEPVVNEIKAPVEIKSEPNNPEKIEEKIEEKVIESPKVEAIQKEQIEEKIKEKSEPVKVEKDSTQELDEKAKVEAFYSTIREKIYANINKNVDKSLIKNGEFVNVKLTILKDGSYEQLIFVEGNKEYFELFRSSIKEAYPVKIDDSLKANFPRYFRMKIEF